MEGTALQGPKSFRFQQCRASFIQESACYARNMTSLLACSRNDINPPSPVLVHALIRVPHIKPLGKAFKDSAQKPFTGHHRRSRTAIPLLGLKLSQAPNQGLGRFVCGHRYNYYEVWHWPQYRWRSKWCKNRALVLHEWIQA